MTVGSKFTICAALFVPLVPKMISGIFRCLKKSPLFIFGCCFSSWTVTRLSNFPTCFSIAYENSFTFPLQVFPTMLIIMRIVTRCATRFPFAFIPFPIPWALFWRLDCKFLNKYWATCIRAYGLPAVVQVNRKQLFRRETPSGIFSHLLLYDTVTQSQALCIFFSMLSHALSQSQHSWTSHSAGCSCKLDRTQRDARAARSSESGRGITQNFFESGDIRCPEFLPSLAATS